MGSNSRTYSDCNTLQHTATHCSHTATQCNIGVYTWPDGQEFEGLFKQDTPVKGYLTTPCGARTKLYFADGCRTIWFVCLCLYAFGPYMYGLYAFGLFVCGIRVFRGLPNCMIGTYFVQPSCMVRMYFMHTCIHLVCMYMGCVF